MRAITAIVIPVDSAEPVRLEQIDPNSLDTYSRLVGGGHLQVVEVDRPEASIYMDEDGKGKKLPVNERATAFAWCHQSVLRDRRDPIVGQVFIVGTSDGSTDRTVPPELVHLLTEATRFKVEARLRVGSKWQRNTIDFTALWDAYIHAAQLGHRAPHAIEVRVVPIITVETLERWYQIGSHNPWISEAEDPPFTRDSFVGCYDVDELAERLTAVSWGIGTAFYYNDLCFIQQVAGGDEWLAIRHGIAFESITVGPSIERGDFPRLIHRLLSATKEQCEQLTY